MKIYNNSELNEHVQWLIRFMQKYFPNGFEMTVSSDGAELNSINSVFVILDDDTENRMRELGEALQEGIKKGIGDVLKQGEKQEHKTDLNSVLKENLEKSYALYAATNEYDDFVGLTD